MAKKMRGDASTNLNAVTSTGAGSGLHVRGDSFVAAIIRATSVTTGGTVKLQGCDSDSATDANWWDLATVTVSANGTQEVVVENPPRWVRLNLTARTDGTYTGLLELIAEAS